MNIIKTDPITRINDKFVTNSNINCTPAESWYCHPIISGRPNSTRYRADFYKKIALDIVTESVFNYPYPYISEKTLRPIACKRMFIIVGAANTLSLLKDYGFQSWDGIIDESYDQIADPEKRFIAVTDSIKHFCSLPLPTVKKFLHDNQDRLNHNFKVLQNLQDLEVNRISNILKGIID